MKVVIEKPAEDVSCQTPKYKNLTSDDVEILSEDVMDIEDKKIKEQEILEAETTKNIKDSFTLKRLVRLLHINNPVSHVMAILGKR